MRPPITWTIVTAVLFLTSALRAETAMRSGASPGDSASSPMCVSTATLPASSAGALLATGAEAGAKWIVDRADNICGLDDAKMLSKPAKVDYDSLLKSTTEMKKIRDDKIDPSSPEGIRLRQAAVDRVRTASDKVRVSEGYCSVWKQVRHQDGRTIPDITDLVKAQL